MKLLGRQLATSVASVVLVEEEIRRAQMAASQAMRDQEALQYQLAEQAQESEAISRRFQRVAQFGAVAIYITNAEGNIVYCNQTWHDITGLQHTNATADEWSQLLVDEDVPKFNKLHEELFTKLEPLTFALRFKKPWLSPPNSAGVRTQTNTWLLCTAYPDVDEHGIVKGGSGCFTDISHQKWAESIQKQRMEDALESDAWSSELA